MKIRIKGNTLRLRLIQTEVGTFAKDGICSNCITFPKVQNGVLSSNKLEYVLKVSTKNSFSCTFYEGKIVVLVPENEVLAWAKDELKVEIKTELPLPNQEVLMILIEKDFACLTNRTDEDESDNFPNPLSKHLC